MTQSSVALSVDWQSWLVLNASPDIRDQLCAPGLAPVRRRGAPVAAAVLTLREGTPFRMLATEAVQAILDQPVFRVLNPDLVSREVITLDQPVEVLPGLQVTLFPVPGKVALFMEEGEVATGLVGEQTLRLILAHGERRLACIPGCAKVTPELRARISGADLLLFDGTVWRDDEMAATGTGVKTGARMGHIAMSGPAGSMAALAAVPLGQRMFIHINNTNPVLQPAAPERAELLAEGWQLARDGMEMVL